MWHETQLPPQRRRLLVRSSFCVFVPRRLVHSCPRPRDRHKRVRKRLDGSWVLSDNWTSCVSIIFLWPVTCWPP